MYGTDGRTTPNLPRALGYVASDIKVVHTGLAVPEGRVQKQIGKSYAAISGMASLVLRLSCGGGGKRAWYTLFTHAPSSLGNLHTTPLH